MKTNWFNFALIKQPSAFLPLAMSLAALALVLGHAVIFGIVHQADEGTAAHIWQILMAVQLPIVAYFITQMAAEATKRVAADPHTAGWHVACQHYLGHLAHLAFDLTRAAFFVEVI
jgi:hypothetical protein